MVGLKKALSYAGAASVIVSIAMSPVFADFTCNFELGYGKNARAIGTDVGGFSFSTLTGGSMYYADIDSGGYRATSDNGKIVEDGEYFMSGNVAAFVTDVNDVGKVTFLNGTASYLTIGYSTGYAFSAEAYNATGALLSTANGAINSRSNGGTGLGYVTVNGQGISYVLLRGTGGHWMVDNLTTDAPVPEPASLLALAGGLFGMFGCKLVRRGK